MVKTAFFSLLSLCLLIPGGNSQASQSDDWVEICENLLLDVIFWETDVFENGPPEGDTVDALEALNNLKNVILEILEQLQDRDITQVDRILRAQLMFQIDWLREDFGITLSSWH